MGGDPYISSIGLSSADNTYQDGLIGLFTDLQGQRYFMIQNLYHGMNLTASQAASTITINFNTALNYVYKLDRTTGLSDQVALTNGGATLTCSSMPGGTADLYSYTPFTLAQTENMVQNPGFELGTVDWTNMGNATYVNNSSLAHSGNWCMQIGYPGGGGAIETLAGLPHAVYTASGWLNPASRPGSIG